MSVSQWPEKTSKFFKEVRVEMQKVSWPNRQEVVNSTVLVLVMVLILSIYMAVVDGVFGNLMSLVIRG